MSGKEKNHEEKVFNGMYGISAMEVNRAGIKACKSWIFIDDYMLCLGAGIQSDSNLVVTTAIEQCHRTGDLSILQDGVWNKVAGQWKSVNAEQRFFHQIQVISYGTLLHLLVLPRWHNVQVIGMM